MNKSNSEKWMKNFAGAKSLEEVVLMSAKVNKSLSCGTTPDSEYAVTARNREHYADKKKIASLNSEISRLKFKMESMQKDADRYLWLRNQHWNDSIMCVVIGPKKNVKLGSDCPTLVRLDDAIDEAMK